MMLHQRPQLHISTRWIGLVVTLALAATAASADDGVAPDMVTLLGVRSATVAPNGAAFITFGAASRRDTGAGFVAETDSALGLGYTIGDAGTGIGLQFGVSFTGLSQGLGSSGQFSLKAGHLMRGSRVPTFIGVSVEHLAAWGTSSGLPVALRP